MRLWLIKSSGTPSRNMPTSRIEKIEFDTTEFQFSHGTLPRGVGSWAFEIKNLSLDPVPVFFSGTYSEARKACVAKLREALRIFGFNRFAGTYITLNVCP
jgi:hypothetical protein